LVNPRRGVTSIRGTAAVNGNLWTFTAPANFDLGAYTGLGFYVAPTANWPNAKQWTIQWTDISNNLLGLPVVLKHGTFNFVGTGMTPNLYQQIVIPTSLFGLNGNPNTRILRMLVAGGTSSISFNLDDVFLSNGLDPTAPIAPQVIGTANEVTVVTVANISTVSLPAALTFTGKTVTGGRFVLPASTTAGDFLVLPHGTAPTTPTNGAIWSTTAGFFGRVNGVTVGPFGTSGAAGTGTVNVGAINSLAYYAAATATVSAAPEIVVDLTSNNRGILLTSSTYAYATFKKDASNYMQMDYEASTNTFNVRAPSAATAFNFRTGFPINFYDNGGTIRGTILAGSSSFIFTGNTVFDINSTSTVTFGFNAAAANNSLFRFTQAAVAKSYVGIAGGGGAIISGSVTSDLCFRSEGFAILFSTDSGGSAGMTISGNVVKIGSANMPTAAGTSGNVLTSNGTNWVSQAAGGGITSSAVNQVAVYTSATTIAGSVQYLFNTTTHTLTVTDNNAVTFLLNSNGSTSTITMSSQNGLNRIINFQNGGNQQGSIGNAGNTNDGVTGSGPGDNFIRTETGRKILMSADGGVKSLLTIHNGGYLTNTDALGDFRGDFRISQQLASVAVNLYLNANNAYGRYIVFQNGGNQEFMFGSAGDTNHIITGAGAGDALLRTQGKPILFSTVALGTSFQLRIHNSGYMDASSGQLEFRGNMQLRQVAATPVLLYLTSTNAQSRRLIFTNDLAENCSIGCAGDTNQVITGAGAGDMVIRTQGLQILFSTHSSGTTYIMRMHSGGYMDSSSGTFEFRGTDLRVRNPSTAAQISLSSPNGVNRYITFYNDSIVKGYMGGVGNSGTIITGSPGPDEMFFRTEGYHIWWSTDSGASAAMQLTNAGRLNLLKTTATSSSTTGALVVSGGVGIAGALNVAGVIGTNTSFFGSTTTQVVIDITSSASDPYFKLTSDSGATQVFFQASTGSGSVGTITNQPFVIRSFNTVVASFGPTLVAIPSAIFTVTGTGNVFAFSTVGPGLNLRNTSDTTDAKFLTFENGSSTIIGSVTRVGTTAAVVYNTSSDSRLKTAITNFEGSDSGPLIDLLQPRRFNWRNVPGTSGHGHIGFIAQEMAAADPIFAKIGAVSIGDSDPNPNNISIVWQRSDIVLIPILVAEIKALRTRVALLEAFNPP
jgi:hypothetical protein